MAHGGQRGRDGRLHVAQNLVGCGEATEFDVGDHEQRNHAHDHNRSLKCIGQHDALDPARDHVGGDDGDEQVEGCIVRDVEDWADEFGSADNNSHGIKRH